MPELPILISVVFIITTLLAVFIFAMSARNPATVLLSLLVWLALQGAVAATGFYTITKGLPPRFFLLIGPPLVLIVIFFITSGGRRFIDHLNIRTLMLLHSMRILVELLLFQLYVYKRVPLLMTFGGGNLDILSGLSAIPIFYFGFVKNRLNAKVIIAWNVVCLLLLINIVVRAILSAPFPFQRIGFSQPNVAILYFPFIWLPCCIVPLVLLAHLAAIRKLRKFDVLQNP